MRIAGDNTREFLQRIDSFVKSDGGRNLNEMSRSLSIPYQTIRFRMLHLRDQGISIKPVIDFGKLGLGRFKAAFKVSNDLPNEESFFKSLSQIAGLICYARTEISQVFYCEFSVLSNKEKGLRHLLATLEAMKIIESFKLTKIAWSELLPMQTRFYDYVTQNWQVDYSKLIGDPSVHYETKPSSGLERFDHKDLVIIRSLQRDPWIKVTELSQMLDIPEADMAYHLNRHVFGRKLIRNFVLKWTGTQADASNHSIVPMTIVFDEIDDSSARHAMSVITSIPFTWNHMKLEDSTYSAELLVPLKLLPETLRYISDRMRQLDLVPRIHFVDPDCSSSFDIPCEMHDDENGWTFNAEESIGKLMQVIRTHG
jgi:DNA-binding Lrp family transcriptional regulator